MIPKARKAVFPAAGLGTRFLPATKAQPKEMLPLVDKPLIQYGVEEAIHSGLQNIIIVTGRGKSSIEDHFDVSFEMEHLLETRGKKDLLALVRGISDMIDVSYVRQKEALGLGHAVLRAKELVGQEPFCVVLSDDVIDSEVPCLRQLQDVYEFYGASVVALMEVPKDMISAYGVVDAEPVDHMGQSGRLFRIRNMVEKPKAEDAPSNLAIIGRYVLTPEIFPSIEAVEPGVGREFSGAGFNATLRDYARFGQMVLDGGVANGSRIVAADWIAQSTTPSGAEDQRRGGYGLQWWTIGDSTAFSAIGLQGQYIYIDPDTRTVVVKLSYFPPGDNSALDAETQAFMAAASAWNPR